MFDKPVPEIQVGVSGIITPTSPLDTFAVAHPFYASGGWKYVDNIVDRDAILDSRRIPEITVIYVLSDGHFYQLRGGILNTDWVDQGTDPLGATSGPGGDPVYSGQKTVYVDQLNGDDTTGVVNQASFPFQTGQAAIDYAATLSPSQTNIIRIQFFDGFYTEDLTVSSSFIELKGKSVRDDKTTVTFGTPGSPGTPSLAAFFNAGFPNAFPGQTMTIGPDVFTAVTVAPATAFEFQIAGTANDTLNNLVNAINTGTTIDINAVSGVPFFQLSSNTNGTTLNGTTISTTLAGLIPTGAFTGGTDPVPGSPDTLNSSVNHPAEINGDITINADSVFISTIKARNVFFGASAANNNFEMCGLIGVSALIFRVLSGNSGETNGAYFNDCHGRSIMQAGQISGTFIHCTAIGGSLGGGASSQFSGYAEHCEFGNNSYGRSASNLSVFRDCRGGSSCFGFEGFEGLATNCTAGDDSFGVTFNGVAQQCMGGERSFGGTDHQGESSYCTAGNDSFGGTNFDGTSNYCIAGETSFGSVSIAGVINNCIGGESCFKGTTSISATLNNCNALFDSFNGVFVGATLNSCKAGGGSFGVTNDTYDLNTTFNDCIGENGSFNGLSNNINTTFSRCLSGNDSWRNIQNGSFFDCTSGSNSFGNAQYNTDVILGGRFINCKAKENSFYFITTGSSSLINIDIAAIYSNCFAEGANCFASANNVNINLRIAGIYRECESTGTSFGINTNGSVQFGPVSAPQWINCRTNGGFIQCTTLNGGLGALIKDCTSITSPILTASGTASNLGNVIIDRLQLNQAPTLLRAAGFNGAIRNTAFKAANPTGTFGGSALALADGAIVDNCLFVKQFGGVGVFGIVSATGGAVNAQITNTAVDTLDPLVTNSITTSTLTVDAAVDWTE